MEDGNEDDEVQDGDALESDDDMDDESTCKFLTLSLLPT